MSLDKELDVYRQEATSWDADRIAQMRRSERAAWWTAGGGWSCAMMSAAALAMLTPLKRVDPFIVRVDNTTGVVDVVPLYTGGEGAGESVTRYLLAHYVTVCERFNYATAESDYQECGAFHSAQRNQAWYAEWNPANPASPLNVYKDGTVVRARVAAVSFFKRANGLTDLAQVRYVKGRHRDASTDEESTHWIATVQYRYGEPSKDPQTRGWNPLGFEILDFHAEQEVIADPAAVKGSRP